MVSPDGPPVSNPLTGTWRNSFADKGQKGRDLQKFDRVEELICDLGVTLHSFSRSSTTVKIMSKTRFNLQEKFLLASQLKNV
jgi:hypothetical protein